MIAISAAHLRQWASSARAGERIQYVHDVMSLDGVAGELARTRDAAYAMHEAGQVALFQARNELGTFDYIAEKISIRTADVLDKLSRSIYVRKR